MQAGKRKREVSSCIPCYTRKQKVSIACEDYRFITLALL